MQNLKYFQKQSKDGEYRLYLAMSAEQAKKIGWPVSGLVKAIEIILDMEGEEKITGGVVNFGEPDDISCYGSDYLDDEDAREVFELVESSEYPG